MGGSNDTKSKAEHNEKARPAATLAISVLALIVSIVSASGSWYSGTNARKSLELTEAKVKDDSQAQAAQANLQAQRERIERRNELRSLVLRLTAIPREAAETQQRSLGNGPASAAFATAILGSFNLETASLSSRAFDLSMQMYANREDLSPGELLAVAQSLQNVAQWARADKVLEASNAISEQLCSPTDYIAGLRLRARQSFRLGDEARGRALFGDALGAYSRKACMGTASRVEVDVNLSSIEQDHALAEFEAGRCPEALSHWNLSREKLAAYPPHMTTFALASLEFLKGQITSRCKAK